MNTAEHHRLHESNTGGKNWHHWGPYLSERQWGTVREDYSSGGSAWDFFPHDHARSRVYRWGEDGIAGISDHLQRLCFGIALWNGKDPILKERLFGLTGPEGNHGEDVKELYYYLDNTPTHSYMKHLYKYPQAAYPYMQLLEANRKASRLDKEVEVTDTGVFDGNRYFDVQTEYAKADIDDILIRITVFNRAEQAADITVLPQLWFRNLWAFGLLAEKPNIRLQKKEDYGEASLTHPELGDYHFYFQQAQQVLFTENETNTHRLWGVENRHSFVKDHFHEVMVNCVQANPADNGTKMAPVYQLRVEARQSIELKLRLSKEKFDHNPLQAAFDSLFADRRKEADEFYATLQRPGAGRDVRNIQRQAWAGMLWSKQYYNIDIPLWLNGDKNQPVAPPESRKKGRNSGWHTLNNEDIISMPDKWEYPWYAAWDLAFHCVSLAMLDARFAKEQLLLFLREWYMHPNGQIPAYEWAFGDVNPPVHAWSCLKVYQMEKEQTGQGDVDFLKKAFHKLCLNFTWWVNRKDAHGKNVFEGGFLGLDNIGIFDRSSAIPGGGQLEQADGTSWMAMYCLNLLAMALEISREDKAFEPMGTKFFEHFALIAESLNRMGKDWTGSWDEEEGFFYDVLALPHGEYKPLKVRSLVGLTTLFATLTIDKDMMKACPEFVCRLNWFNDYLKNNKEYTIVEETRDDRMLLTLLPKKRFAKLLRTMLDEKEFLSEFGIRAVSKIHQNGYGLAIGGEWFGLQYEPAESSTGLFGGNSNWRGPIWMPMNYMLIEALKNYYAYYGDDLKVECPTGSGNWMNLEEAARELSARLLRLFTLDERGNRAVNGLDAPRYRDEHFRELVLFYEYFHGDNGRGVGASHQTGWTGVIAELIDFLNR